MCIAFAGFLRTGEFTYEKWDTGNHIVMVSRRAIQFGKDSVTLTLPKSKTDVFGKGTPIPMPATGDAICPREAIKTLLTRFPAPLDAPLFSRFTQFGYLEKQFFTRKWFVDNVRDLLVLVGINPEEFNGHSFRRGAAHSAAAAGMTNDEIKQLGRWKSDAYKLYTGHDGVRRLNLASKASRRLRSAPQPQR